MTLPRLLWGIVARPVWTLDAFHLHEKRLRLRYGLMAYGAGGVLEALLELPRAVSTNSPYPWALPFLAALFSLPWVIAASWFHLFAKTLGGKGDLKNTLAFLGLPSFVLMTALGVVDTLNLYVLPHSFRGVGLGRIEFHRTLSIIAGAWALVLCVLAIKIAHAVSLPKAIAIAAIAVVVGTPLVLFIYYL